MEQTSLRHLRHPQSTHSCSSNETVSAVAWPPARRSILHFSCCGRACVAEVDIASMKEAQQGSANLSFHSLFGREMGSWIFEDWATGFDHALALPLITCERFPLSVVLFSSSSGLLNLRLLYPTESRARPRDFLTLAATLQPASQTHKPVTHCCLAEDREGGLLFLRYCAGDGVASLHVLEPAETLDHDIWHARPLGAAELLPGRYVTRILPVQGFGANSVTVLQYDVICGDVTVWKLDLRNNRVSAQQLWTSFWVRNYPNQHIVSTTQHCCLVEYCPGNSQLNVGTFSPNGSYQSPYGDRWRCSIPCCLTLRSVWPPVDGNGLVALLDAPGGGLAICELPIDVNLGHDRGHGRWGSPSRFLSPLVGQLLDAIRETNWQNRRAAVLLSLRPDFASYSKDTHMDNETQNDELESSIGLAGRGAIWILQALQAVDVGLWRQVVAML